jgi:C-terminal processing protease CtpA/Prc
MVLDLRNNPGGLLGEAQQVLGGLLGPVAIGSTEGRTGVRSLLAQGNRRSTLPLAVLMNRGTASGLVNSAFPLADSSVLLIGSGRLVTAGGKQILRTGVVPMISQPGPSPWVADAIRPASSQDVQFIRAVAEIRRRRQPAEPAQGMR